VGLAKFGKTAGTPGPTRRRWGQLLAGRPSRAQASDLTPWPLWPAYGCRTCAGAFNLSATTSNAFCQRRHAVVRSQVKPIMMSRQPGRSPRLSFSRYGLSVGVGEAHGGKTG
jgi:hypothetical protein